MKRLIVLDEVSFFKPQSLEEYLSKQPKKPRKVIKSDYASLKRRILARYAGDPIKHVDNVNPTGRIVEGPEYQQIRRN